ncbi:hypothetical protein HYU91_04520 [Candidatus Collierbacteria bacterium]|nr:hypothetical protein [Candidatus Collierbacteria bacterium]
MNYTQTQKSGAPSSVLLKKFSLLGISLGLVYGFVALLAVVNLVGTNALATQGIVLDNISRQTNKISKENQILSVEIGKKTNLSYIESTAIKLGYKRVRTNLVIPVNEAVAAVIQSVRYQQ